MLTHRHIAGEASQGLELLPHKAVSDHDDALLGCALRKFLGVPGAQAAVKGPEHLAMQQHLRLSHADTFQKQPKGLGPSDARGYRRP